MSWVYAFVCIMVVGLLLGLTEKVIKDGWKKAAMMVIEYGGPLLFLVGLIGAFVALIVVLIGLPGE